MINFIYVLVHFVKKFLFLCTGTPLHEARMIGGVIWNSMMEYFRLDDPSIFAWWI